MATYVFVDADVIDEAAQAEYRNRAAGVVQAYGGRVMARGDVVEILDGTPAVRRRLIALEFPTVEQASAWSRLEDGTQEHQEVRELRNRAFKMNSINIVEGDL